MKQESFDFEHARELSDSALLEYVIGPKSGPLVQSLTAKFGTLAKLRGVATDGHQLARYSIALPDGAAGICEQDVSAMPGVIVPRWAIAQLDRLLSGVDTAVEIINGHGKEPRLVFATDAFILTTKKIDGTFPDYSRVIPQPGTEMLVRRTHFADALTGVLAIGAGRDGAARLAVRGGKVELSCAIPNVGEATELVYCQWGAPPFEIGFNGRYLQNALGVLTGDDVRFSFNDPAGPARIEDPADDSLLCVLMPMRV